MGIMMLVLTRKENESLIIGDNIKLTILAVKGGQVRIGIDAPVDVPIHRAELLLKTEQDKTPNTREDKAIG